MAMRVELVKEAETEADVRYRFQAEGGAVRHLVLDKGTETIAPVDGVRDGVFRGAASALARSWVGSGVAPERLVHQS
ncbi:hypothetical protein [Actinokineospora bangkokensis]|uniref:Uncharacterized protein n=1 Tax=Actinokineospora bangkokensis TaxID=1193682 RepID=A0A1Q9LTE3_9PSEU|nr:hypothetical protein [Actinokineospora bangkokensis]OLR95290.1 hypothetical protein BJP25_07350 [Actinokineospora bangkokensis]